MGLYIDRGDEQANRAIFEALAESRADVEERFGEPLVWQALEGRRACRIKLDLPDGGLRDQDKWPEIHETMIDAMIRLEKALRPHIDALDA